MYHSGKTKYRETWFLSSVDSKVKNKIKVEAKKRGISAWLLTEYLLKSSLGIIPDETPAKMFTK